MISLDEDYLGWDANGIILRGLKVCGGVVCRLSNGNLIGAHFTPGSTPEEILTACTHIRANFMTGGATVAQMYWIANLGAWAGRGDKYASLNALVADLKAMFNFNGQINVFDKNTVANSVDVQITNPAFIGYRVTPNPEPDLQVASAQVKFVQTQFGGKTPVIHNSGTFGKVHKLPQSATAFAPFAIGAMTPM